MAGAGTGIGIGIGNAMGDIGDAVRARKDRQRQEREKQAEVHHAKGLELAGKLLQAGYTTKAVDGQHQLVDAKTGQPATNAPFEINQTFNELLNTSKQATSLFPADQPNLIAQHFRKWLGKPLHTPTDDTRLSQYSPEALAAQAPQDKSLSEMNSIRQEIDAAYPNATPQEKSGYFAQAMNKKLGVTPPGQDFEPSGEPKLDKTTGRYYQTYASKSDPSKQKTVKMPMDFQPKGTLKDEEKPKKAPTVKEVAGATVITDPETGIDYGSWNAAQAPPAIKSMYEGIEKDKKAKADAAEAKELDKVKAAEERQNKSFEHQDAMAAQRYKEAYDRQDHAEANAIRKGAETRYNSALSLSAFADEAKKNVSAAKDKLLAGRLIRESEGRFNPAQYDNLVKNAGLANTFSQWLESAETGQLTGPVRDQLVDAAHALLSSAKTAVDAIPKGDSKSKPDDQVEDLEFGPDGKLRPVKK